MFTYDQKGSADHARTTLEKIVLHIGSIHGQDISTELDTRQPVVFEEPKHSDEVKKLHEEKEPKRRKRHDRLQAARKGKVTALQTIVDAGGKEGAEAAIPLAELLTEMEEDEDKMAVPLPITLQGDEKIAHDNLWKNHRERTARHHEKRGLAFSLIRGQCTDDLLDKMRHDPKWETLNSDPLLLLDLIEKTVMAQTDDECPFATVHDQEVSLLAFQQNTMPLEQWCV